jgi:predicted  nucleic acid-binding Zn-ribbon protein
MMQQSEFDQINAILDRAEFAMKELRKKADELSRKQGSAKTLEEMATLNLEAAELKQQLRKISDAVHTGNPAPHLRLVLDT